MKGQNELNHKSKNILEKKEAIKKDVKYQKLISKSKSNLFPFYFRQKIYFQII